MSLQFGFPSKERMSYDSAVLYVFMYNQKGSTGWRMPTFDEWNNHASDKSAWAEGDDEEEIFDDDLWYALPVRDVE